MKIPSVKQITEETLAELGAAKADIERYRLTLLAIKSCTLPAPDFGDWVQMVCEEVLDGQFPECHTCGTFVHDGPCVQEDSDSPEASGADPA